MLPAGLGHWTRDTDWPLPHAQLDAQSHGQFHEGQPLYVDTYISVCDEDDQENATYTGGKQLFLGHRYQHALVLYPKNRLHHYRQHLNDLKLLICTGLFLSLCIHYGKLLHFVWARCVTVPPT